MLTLAVFFGSGVAVLAARIGFGRVRLDWQQFLTPAGERALTALAERLASDREMVRLAYDHARALAPGSSRRRAVLDAAHGLMVELARDRVRLLDTMRSYSRMATQIESRAIGPTEFHLPLLAARTALANVAHLLLVGSPERFRWQLSVLRRGVRDVVSATRSVALDQAGPATLAAALSDWEAIDRQTIASFHAVATAILDVPIRKSGLTPRQR